MTRTRRGSRVSILRRLAAPACALGVLALALVLSPFAGSATAAGDATPRSAATAQAGDAPHPPIAVRFSLAAPGFVTLVIDDDQGVRVRNLLSETPFPAGENVAWWDGLDDLGRDTDAAKHSVYHVPGRLVAPGSYHVRGIVRPEIALTYETTAYTPGDPPWMTKDRSSAWLANHTPPSAVLYVPEGGAPDRPGHPAPGGQILVGSFVSEGGSGLAWLNLDGKKLNGQEWVGGVWTGATQLARDEGDKPVPGVYAYTGSAWRGDKYNGNRPELRLHMLIRPDAKTKAPGDKRMGTGEDPPVLKPNYQLPAELPDPEHGGITVLGGLAARNGILVAAVMPLDQLIFIDVAAQKTLATATLEKPRGLAFDRQGRLLAISGHRIVRVPMPALDAAAPTTQSATLAPPEVLVAAGLEDPQQLCTDPAGNIYVSDRGDNHQVKVFASDGKPLRAIGKKGKPTPGPYDPERMTNPNGISIDGRGRLWVAETDPLPKRVSVWSTADGKLEQAFYGPAHYGGGGSVDSTDPTRFFYADSGGAMEFKIDPDGKHPRAPRDDQPVSVYVRPESDPLKAFFRDERSAGPDTSFTVAGRTYLTDSYSTGPTNGIATASLWLLRDGVAKPVAVIGQVDKFPAFKTGGPLASRLPQGINPDKLEREHILFAWSDRNDNGSVDADEVQCAKGETLSVDFQPDLSAVTGTGLLFKPTGFTPGGAPLFDINGAKTIVEGTQRPVSSGGGQALTTADGRFIFTNAPKPFSPYGIGGGKDGKATWSYPSLWPGLHASHIAPVPESPGELIGTTRLLGPVLGKPGADLRFWAINGNKGSVYVFTTDGLFVTTLFRDGRGASWAPPSSAPGTPVNDQSLTEENFFPSITQTTDGRVYISAHNCSLVRVDGLDQVRRLPDSEVTVSTEQLAAARQFFLDGEAARQAAAERQAGPKVLAVTLRGDAGQAPVVDGKSEDWAGAAWATIDERQSQVGDWGKRKVVTAAALCVAKDRLYLGLKTDDPKLLVNSGESLQNLFKTGGAIDLMIGTADVSTRLLVTRVNGKTAAMLYRPVDPAHKSDPVSFSSPLRTLVFDRVQNVSDQVELASAEVKDDKGHPTEAMYELSVPLDVLGLKPQPGESVKGDVGVLRGNGFQTLQRAYWSNKATGLVSDVPSEAELTPKLWGTFKFEEKRGKSE